MNMIVKTSVAATVALIGFAIPAHADRLNGSVTVSSVPTMTVSFAELDITKPRGLEVLYSRIERAARIVCDFDHSLQPLARRRNANSCYQAAIDDAVRQINRPTLTALHRAKSKSAVG